MKTKNAYRYFWAVAIICGFLACLNYVSDDNKMFDINIHDTYYVIAHTHLYTIFFILYFTLGLIYRISSNLKLNNKLTAAHTIVTVGGFIACYILWAITSALHNPHSLLDNSMEIFTTGTLLIILVVSILQILLPINLITGLVKRNY